MPTCPRNTFREGDAQIKRLTMHTKNKMPKSEKDKVFLTLMFLSRHKTLTDVILENWLQLGVPVSNRSLSNVVRARVLGVKTLKPNP